MPATGFDLSQYADTPPSANNTDTTAPPVVSGGFDLSSYADPNAKAPQPEEVAIEPNNPASQKAAFSALGINLDLAKKSKNYNPTAFDDAYTDATNRAKVDSDVPGETDESGNVQPTGAIGNAWQGAKQFGRDTKGLFERVTGTPADIENQKLQDYIQRNVNERVTNQSANIDDQGNYTKPLGQTVGYGLTGLAAAVPATLGADVVAGAGLAAAGLGEVSGVVGGGLSVARAAATNAVGGAAASPTDPETGAKWGAASGAAIRTVGIGARAGLSALNKNGALANEVVQAGDTLNQTQVTTLADNSPSLATAFGNPNVAGGKAVAGIPFVGKFLSKALGNEQADATAYAKGNNVAIQAGEALEQQGAQPGANITDTWRTVLKDEPVFKNNPSAAHDPTQFARFYPQLSEQGKLASIAGIFQTSLENNAIKGAKTVTGDGGQVVGYNLKGIATDLDSIIKTTGNQSVITGQSYFTLRGLQKLLEGSQTSGMNMSADNVSSTIAKGSNAVNKPITTIAKGVAVGAGSDAMEALAGSLGIPGAGHVIGAVAKPLTAAAIVNRLANMAINNKTIRNQLITLSGTKTPGQFAKGVGAITSSVIAQGGVANKQNDNNQEPPTTSGFDMSSYQ